VNVRNASEKSAAEPDARLPRYATVGARGFWSVLDPVGRFSVEFTYNSRARLRRAGLAAESNVPSYADLEPSPTLVC
jgi:hypothetical protein